jgi:hypothetical protein
MSDKVWLYLVLVLMRRSEAHGQLPGSEYSVATIYA